MPTRSDSVDVQDGTISLNDLNTNLFDQSGSIPSLRTLGTGSLQAAAGNDRRLILADNMASASFVVLAASENLANERVLSKGVGIEIRTSGSNIFVDNVLVGSGTVTILTGSTNELIVQSLFGAQHQYATQQARTTTTLTTFQTIAGISGSVSGLFRLQWSVKVDSEKGCEARLVDDSGNAVGSSAVTYPVSTTEILSVGSTHYFSLSGSYSFSLQYRSTDAGKASGARDAAIELWRIL